MIIRMKKYTMLVHAPEYEGFLAELQGLGVVHPLALRESGDAGAAERERITRLSRAGKFLKSRKPLPADAPSAAPRPADAVLTELAELQAEYERLGQDVVSLGRQIAQLEPWGDCQPQALERLAESGIGVRCWIAAEKKFEENWLAEYGLEIAGRAAGKVFLAQFCRAGETLPEPPAEEFRMPPVSLSGARAALLVAEERLGVINRRFDKVAAAESAVLEAALADTIERAQFVTVRAASLPAVEDQVMVLQGWVPVTREPALLEYLAGCDVAFTATAPQADEAPPVLQKNRAFARLFEPIGKLFALPAYAELDMVPFFAPFFMLFFGLCLGDAGYGVVITLATLVARFKVKKELGTILGFSTVVIGALTGTVFGLTLVEQPAFEPFILIKNTNQLFPIALGIGVVQILFGMALQVVNRARSQGILAGLSPLGWIIMIVSGLLLVAGEPVVGATAAEVAGITVFVGIGLILFFNDVTANVFVRLGKGVWELYNITGFLGDVLSYVRLFALGVSSGILGLVINQIAGQFTAIPAIGPVLFVLVLVVGHTGNLLLSALGSFVHPMRLTFVEFYKNAGFVGGGKAYTPFAKRRPDTGN
jgi:V/A-type H+-transporting ATPase subunit I